MMNFKNKTMILAVVSGLLLTGCGSGSGDGGAPTSSNSVTETVGSGGGSVSLPDKTIVTIDPGVLKDGTTITITRAPAPASTSAEIQSISPLITVTIPPGSILSSASGLDGISVEIPLNEGQTNKTSARKEAPGLVSKSYRVLKVTLKGGKDQIVRFGKIAADATVAVGKYSLNATSAIGQFYLDLGEKGIQVSAEFIAEKIQPNVPTSGTLFEVKSVGNFKDSLSPPRTNVQEGKLPLVLVHGFQLFCDGNAEAYIETWEKNQTTGFTPSFFSNPELQDKYQLFSFSYQTDLSIKENGRLLATALRALFGERPSIIVAHSMGGLVTRSAMVHHVSIGANIGGVITLATPHHGTKKIQEVVGFIDKAICIFATEAQGAKDLTWDNFDSPNGPYLPCVNPFLCGANGLNKIDNPSNYQKYIPYAGFVSTIPCLSSNLITPTPFSKCKDSAQVPVASARFMDFNMNFDTDIYLDKPPWMGKSRTYQDIGHIEIHDDLRVLNQVTQDLLAFYNSISVTNTAPTATITSPVGGTFNQGNAVIFSGTGNDVEDGVLRGGALVWTSSIDGLIGTGTSFTTSGLSVGTHAITLTATDTQGATRSDSTSITVNLQSPSNIKDIWTTSVFSYAPGGGGPGGGLNNHELVVGGWADLYHTLLEFDLSGLPPQASSATLMLFPFTQRGTGTTEMYLDRITEFWDWRTQGTGSDRERLWWVDRPSATQWNVGLLPAPTVGEWYSIDITDLYNAWQNGTFQNFGLQLRPFSNSNRWNEFYSSDFIDDPSLRPRIIVKSGG